MKRIRTLVENEFTRPIFHNNYRKLIEDCNKTVQWSVHLEMCFKSFTIFVKKLHDIMIYRK